MTRLQKLVYALAVLVAIGGISAATYRLASPIFSGTITGIYSLGGTPTIINSLRCTAATPTHTSYGTGAGTGPTAESITGSPCAFEYDVTTGTTPATNATVVTLAVASGVFATTPFCVVSGANQLGAGDGATSGYSVYENRASSTTTSIVLNVGVSLGAGTAYKWIVHCQ